MQKNNFSSQVCGCEGLRMFMIKVLIVRICAPYLVISVDHGTYIIKQTEHTIGEALEIS
jgi:hypothetical protein